jgi:ADP-heptose:LPS heptosyltransferase
MRNRSKIACLQHAGPKCVRIAILRALPGLGDFLCLIPAARALRRSLPHATITLIGVESNRQLASRFPDYFDELLPLPGFPGLWEPSPEALADFPHFLSIARQRRFDLVLQMHGSGTVSNTVARLLQARFTSGYYAPNGHCPDPEFFLPYPEDEAEIRRNLLLLENLGIVPAGEHLEFRVLPEDRQELRRFLNCELTPGGYVCVHPGSRAAARRWKPERFARVADEMAGQGFEVVLTGSQEEYWLNEQTQQYMRAQSLNAAGPIGAGALAALLEGARLVICNDTGVSHLADALRVPSVVIFTAASPARWAPLDAMLHRAVFTAVDCRPCLYSECPIGHPCSTGVTVDMVLSQANDLLAQERRYAA